MFSRGKYILFADADGATDINCLESLVKQCKRVEIKGLSCAIGNRYHEESVAEVRYLYNKQSSVICSEDSYLGA